MATRLQVCLALCSVLGVTHAQPAITTEGESVTINADDVFLGNVDSSSQVSPVSLRQLAAQVSSLQSALDAGTYAQTEDVISMVDAAALGAVQEAVAQAGQRTAIVESRLSVAEMTLATYPQALRSINTIARDVQYLLAHTANSTSCANDGGIHLGNGSCFDPVPQCPMPSTPTGGTLTLSASFIIPGVTATYTCTGLRKFVAGPSIRVCQEESQQFDGSDPQCLTCAVSNCDLCVNTTSTCARCGFGYDLSADFSSCDLRNTAVFIMGGQFLGSGHNHNQVQLLPPNSQQWVWNQPYPPISMSRGAGALIGGVLYIVGSGGHSSLNGAYKRPLSSNTWAPLSMTNAFNSRSPFYATVSGVGTNQDGFYIFGVSDGAVLKPQVTTDQFTAIGINLGARSQGATAVVGDSIYCLGGYTSSRQYSNRVDIYNTTSRTWSTGTAMTEARMNHAAAAYNGKIYVFGGRSPSNVVLNFVEEFDIATNQWTSMANLPEAWEAMSTGPMPTFGNGEILIPFPYKQRGVGVQSSFTYNIGTNQFTETAVPPLQVGQYTVIQGTV